MITFDEFWEQLMGARTVGFVHTKQHKTLPVREGDKEIARYFWDEAKRLTLDVVDVD